VVLELVRHTGGVEEPKWSSGRTKAIDCCLHIRFAGGLSWGTGNGSTGHCLFRNKSGESAT
jgi:hypothetical protein